MITVDPFIDVEQMVKRVIAVKSEISDDELRTLPLISNEVTKRRTTKRREKVAPTPLSHSAAVPIEGLMNLGQDFIVL